MTKLSVNVNKIATLRNARGEDNPNLLRMAKLIESCGAHGITIHPRPDARHITRQDVFDLKKNIATELNIEGYPSPDFIDLMAEIRPHQVTLVPDPPEVLTSCAGFKLDDDFLLVKNSVKKLQSFGSRVSIFVDPKDFVGRNENIIKDCGTDRIELYTKAYAENHTNKNTLEIYRDLAYRVKNLGLGVNAGHDLSLANLKQFITEIPIIDEVSIGHALICDALLFGIEDTMRRYLDQINAAV